MSKRSKTAPASDEAPLSPKAAPPGTAVPVVALGASAGGLKALETFLGGVPADCGMAFVVAMHLSPEHDSQLSRILQAFTELPVTQVGAAVALAPGHVYVISPRQHLSIRGNRLLVSARDRAPAAGVIDHLFQSLAEARREQAVGIVLSGSGTDGTIGSQVIRERGGLVFAQDPGEAEYASMPRSIIATGLVDLVLPASEMAARLLALRDRIPRPGLPVEQEVRPEEDVRPVQAILGRLRSTTGFDFAHFKSATLRRQIGRRMLVLHTDSLPEYADRVEADEEEVGILFRNLLVSVTSFFRDPEAFEVLEREVIPELFKDGDPADDVEPPIVRVWVAGSASGEEAYSLAMLLVEHRDAVGSRKHIQILATDIDEAALSFARRGLYAESITAGLPAHRRQRFFVQKEGAYQVADDIREMVVFAAHDITRDPPFARIDVLSCRNLLMYFEADMQRKVLERCAYSLKPGGHLLLGTAEGTGRAASLFTPVSGKLGIFRRTSTARASSALDFFPAVRATPESQEPKRTSSGKPRKGKSASGSPAFSGRPAGRSQRAAAGDAQPPSRSRTPNASSIMDLERSNDALILANQDMQSLNEELRSMVEEIEVAKEEMQSLNEELATVNQELQNKIEEHRRVNSDLHLLIESTQMATIFLDSQLNVLLYTPESTKLFNLLPIDIGRPLEHLSHRLTYAGVINEARHALEGATDVEREVQANDGSWYMMRATPYQTARGPAGGVVLTFADISSQKRAEQASMERFSLAFHAGPMAASIVALDEGRFLEVNEVFEQLTGYARDEVIGRLSGTLDLNFRLGVDADNAGPEGAGGPGDSEARIRTKSGDLRDVIVATAAIEYEGRPCGLSHFYDVTERKRLEREILQVSDREQRRIGADLHDGLGTHLTGTALMARGLARNLRADRAITAEEIDEIARLLSEGIEQARTLAHGLNPFQVEVRGLTNALKELASGLWDQSGIECTFEETGRGKPLDSDSSMQIFRITQEALANAARHARATRIRVTLHRKGQHARITIRDDGIGFNEAKERVTGMGLSTMRYRANIIGGRLEIKSSPGAGTTVTCSV
jgi:two-component system CheB/CheR fusion protein